MQPGDHLAQLRLQNARAGDTQLENITVVTKPRSRSERIIRMLQFQKAPGPENAARFLLREQGSNVIETRFGKVAPLVCFPAKQPHFRVITGGIRAGAQQVHRFARRIPHMPSQQARKKLQGLRAIFQWPLLIAEDQLARLQPLSQKRLRR